MNPIFRRLIAGLTVIGGLLVIYFELIHTESPAGERWFWIVVAALAVILGIIELLSKDKPKPPDQKLPLEK